MRREVLGYALAGALVWTAGCGTTPTRSSMPDDEAARNERSAERRWEVIGFSREERAIRAITLGAKGPRIAFLAGIHGDEQEGLRHLDEALDVLAAHPVHARVIEDVNPDGTAAGTRTTSAGVDPNRNWPASNFSPARRRGPAPLSEPGVAATHADLVAFDPQLIVVLHSTSRGPFVNYDGPADGFARRFAVAAGDPWRVEPSMGYPTPGSLGTWFGVD
ncbi:MAG: M14 family zinc carboxypeptidase, partial [Planctomycetota bacterium]